jgi:hypothetical protein
MASEDTIRRISNRTGGATKADQINHEFYLMLNAPMLATTGSAQLTKLLGPQRRLTCREYR